MWYIYSIEYFPAIKRKEIEIERNEIIFSDMDGPRVCHIEWIWSEREKQYGILMYIYEIQKKIGTVESIWRAG